MNPAPTSTANFPAVIILTSSLLLAGCGQNTDSTESSPYNFEPTPAPSASPAPVNAEEPAMSPQPSVPPSVDQQSAPSATTSTEVTSPPATAPVVTPAPDTPTSAPAQAASIPSPATVDSPPAMRTRQNESKPFTISGSNLSGATIELQRNKEETTYPSITETSDTQVTFLRTPNDAPLVGEWNVVIAYPDGSRFQLPQPLVVEPEAEGAAASESATAADK